MIIETKYNKFLATFVQSFALFAVKKVLFGIFIYIPLFLFIEDNSFPQETKLSESIISIAEEIAADESDPEMVGLYIEKLYDLYENPVKINSADENELSRLFFLSDFQVKVIADYIKTSGKIVSSYEIADLPGFDQETAIMMSLFSDLEKEYKTVPLPFRRRNSLLTNITLKPGDSDSSWLGSSPRILTKYKFTAGGFSGGILAEKDPGEELLSGNPPLPDLLCGHLEWNGQGFIRRIIIGDYSARFGQGSNINTSIRTGLSLHAPGYMSARSEIRPYNSTDENNFFRGAGAEFSLSNLSMSLFYSQNNIDASLISASFPDKDLVRSFYTSGLHNTLTTIQKKDLLTDIVYGLNFSYNSGNFRAGVIWSEERLSPPFKAETDEPEKLFSFSGKSNSVYTIYYSSLIKRILLFGEMSVNGSLKYAVIQGLTLRPSARLSTNLIYRYYKEGFVSLHGKGSGGNSVLWTGKSILGNFTFEAAKSLFISGGCEVIEYPWLRYRASSPSYSIRREMRLRYIRSDQFLVESACYYHLSTTDDGRLNTIPGLEEMTVRSFSTSFRYNLHENLTLGTRFYYKISEQSGSEGMLMLQDINYRFGSIPVTIWIRYSLFSTDDWDTRIYAYENDLLYTYTIPALYGRGCKNYIMLSWRIRDRAEIRFKYGVMSKQTVGIENPFSDEYRIQIRIFI
jgi:hypothetical protein